MDLYSIALFVHIVGAVLIFVALTIEGVSLRVGFSAASINQVLGPISAVAVLVPGAYMMWAQVGWSGWVAVGIVVYVLIAAGGAFTGINVMRGRMSSGAAGALMATHRALVALVRRRVLAGQRGQHLAGEYRTQVRRGFALLERGLAGYAVKA